MSSVRILIADDAAFMRTVLRDTLKKEGYEIAGEAVDGEQALARFRELRPDLMTLDITMPKMDGLAVLKHVRAEDPRARVVMCSALGQESVVKDALLSGARDYLIKPFESDQVLATIRRALLERQEKPNSVLEELIDWYDLGELLIRHGFANFNDVKQLREQVRSGGAKNLYAAVVEKGLVGEDELQSLLAEGHRDVSLAYLLLKANAVTMEQLRCALVIMRKNGRLLGYTLMEQGFTSQDLVAGVMKKIPPYKPAEPAAT